MDDVRPRKCLGYLYALGEYVIQHQHLSLGFVVDPVVGRRVQVDVGQANFLLGGFVLVLELSLVGINYHRPVVGSDQVLVSPRLQSLGHALDLPGGGGATGVPVLPGDVHLQKSLDIGGQELPDPRQVHGPAHVSHRRLGRGSHHRHHRAAGAGLAARTGAMRRLGCIWIEGSHCWAPIWWATIDRLPLVVQ